MLGYVGKGKALMKKTKEMSKLAGVSRRTLQYYDDEGLLITERTYDNLRLYGRQAMERIWGINFEGESRTLDVHIKTLRQKLKSAGSLIKTVRNVGYMIE